MAGSPAAKIIAHAGQNKIDLIVMAAQGRTAMEHALIGSVKEKIVRLGPCAVPVVRHP